MPAKSAVVRLDRAFSPQEMKRIRKGLVPQQMEDKWFIYWKDEILFFHRSWTGFCIYVVRFATEGDSCRMIEADVNRDPEQNTEADEQKDAEMISYLIDVLLLDREATFPSDETSPGKRALGEWSEIGRAVLGQHPDDEPSGWRSDPADPEGRDDPNSKSEHRRDIID